MDGGNRQRDTQDTETDGKLCAEHQGKRQERRKKHIRNGNGNTAVKDFSVEGYIHLAQKEPIPNGEQ